MLHNRSKIDIALVLQVMIFMTGGIGFGQDMEPRAYNNAPTGLNFLLVTLGHSSGNVVLDAGLPIEDAEADVNLIAAAYVRSLNVFGKSAKLGVVVPVADADARGLLAGDFTEIDRQGLGDTLMRFNLNFYGAPALQLKDFARYRQKTIVGLTLQAGLPTGQYDETKRINLGTNRYSFRGELGLSHRIERWNLEAALGHSRFTDNDEFLVTSTRTQDPVTSLQGHLVYTIRRGMWVALNNVYFWGGERNVDGVPSNDRQENTRTGLTFTLPLARGHALKFVATTGVSTRIGADFDTVAIAWQHTFGRGF
ncbi:MAG: transporter [Acidobacteriota bacterium]|nr:transporter [Acidobacteriota bacterium]